MGGNRNFCHAKSIVMQGIVVHVRKKNGYLLIQGIIPPDSIEMVGEDVIVEGLFMPSRVHEMDAGVKWKRDRTVLEDDYFKFIKKEPVKKARVKRKK